MPTKAEPLTVMSRFVCEKLEPDPRRSAPPCRLWYLSTNFNLAASELKPRNLMNRGWMEVAESLIGQDHELRQSYAHHLAEEVCGSAEALGPEEWFQMITAPPEARVKAAFLALGGE